MSDWHRIDHIPRGTPCTVRSCVQPAAWVIDTNLNHRICLCHEHKDAIEARGRAWAERIAKEIDIMEGEQQ